MFKKIILSFVFAVIPFIFSSAYAVQFTAVSSTEFNQSSNDTPFWRLIIKADEHDEINAQGGIAFILPKGEAIQWDRTKAGIQISGTAANKVVLEPKISDDLSIFRLAVQTNWGKGEELYIDGLTPRTFRKAVSSRPLGLDINNNGIRDVDNFYPFSVKDVERSDHIGPYDPKEFKSEYLKNEKKIKLTWQNPKDYDFWQVAITRERTVNGKKETIDVYGGHEEAYTDTSVIDGEVTYTIRAIDQEGNNSGAVQTVVTVGAIPTPPAPATTPVPANTPTQSPENIDLAKFFDYYYIRYQIKCLATGVDPKDSLCLWAKIDLVYTQEKLGQTKAANAKMLADEINLLSSRIQWPEKRYQDNCVKKSPAEDYCTAFKESLDRQKYFINKK